MSRHNKERREVKREEVRRSLPVLARVMEDVHNDKMPNRSCGECTACCTSLGVVAVHKPQGCRCVHLGERGCSIYDTKPDECSDYFCLWRCGVGEEGDRPDKIGVLLNMEPGLGTDDKEVMFSVCVYELRPGAMMARYESVDDLFELVREMKANLVVYVHGVPFPVGNTEVHTVAEEYAETAGPVGKTHYVRQGRKLVAIGVVDDATGDLWFRGGYVPKGGYEQMKSDPRKMLALLPTFSADEKQT